MNLPIVLRALFCGLPFVIGGAATASAAPPRLAEGSMYWMAVQLEPASQGLRVEAVMPRGPAAFAGILPGDILVSAAGKPLPSVAAFVRQVQASDGRGLQIELLRSGEFVTLMAVPGIKLADGAVVMPEPFRVDRPESVEAPPAEVELATPAPQRIVQELKSATAEQPQPKPIAPQPQILQQARPANAKTETGEHEQALIQELQRLKQHAAQLEQQIQRLQSALAEKEPAESKPQPATAKKAAEAKKREAPNSEISKPQPKKPETDKPDGKQPKARKPGEKK